MKVKIVKIRKVNDREVDEYYFGFLGEIVNVVEYKDDKFTLAIPTFAGDKVSYWSAKELEFVSF